MRGAGGSGGGGAGATKRQAAAERSREAILDAAENLFARKGYENTSLKEVGEEAGLSRGTPAYFFGSKEGLYRAVVERMADEVRAFVSAPHAGPVSGERGGDDVAGAMARAVGGYVDFLASRPNFVALVGREALDAGRLSEGGPPLASFAEIVGDPGAGFLAEGLKRGPFREDVDPKQLAISIIALCFFPFAHAEGLGKQLGVAPYSPAFLEERKKHVVDLVLKGILAPEGPGPSGNLAGRKEGDREQGEREEPEEGAE